MRRLAGLLVALWGKTNPSPEPAAHQVSLSGRYANAHFLDEVRHPPIGLFYRGKDGIDLLVWCGCRHELPPYNMCERDHIRAGFQGKRSKALVPKQFWLNEEPIPSEVRSRVALIVGHQLREWSFCLRNNRSKIRQKIIDQELSRRFELFA